MGNRPLDIWIECGYSGRKLATTTARKKGLHFVVRRLLGSRRQLYFDKWLFLSDWWSKCKDDKWVLGQISARCPKTLTGPPCFAAFVLSNIHSDILPMLLVHSLVQANSPLNQSSVPCKVIMIVTFPLFSALFGELFTFTAPSSSSERLIEILWFKLSTVNYRNVWYF